MIWEVGTWDREIDYKAQQRSKSLLVGLHNIYFSAVPSARRRFVYAAMLAFWDDLESFVDFLWLLRWAARIFRGYWARMIRH